MLQEKQPRGKQLDHQEKRGLEVMTSPQTYTVTAFDGSTQVGQDTQTIPANTASGFAVIDLKATIITSLTVTPNNTSEWDFAVDSIAFNEPVSAVINPNGTPINGDGGTNAIPLPAGVYPTFLMLGALGAVHAARRARLRLHF